MGTTDKSDKPAKDQLDQDTQTDAEEVAQDQDLDVPTDDVESADDAVLATDSEDLEVDPEAVEDADLIEIEEPVEASGEDDFDDVDAVEEDDLEDTEALTEAEDESDLDDVEDLDDLAEAEAEAEVEIEDDGDLDYDPEDADSAAEYEVAEAIDEVDSAETSAAPEPAAKRGGFVPMVLGGAIAAAIGFGGAVYLGDSLGIGADQAATLEALRADLSTQQEALSALQDGQSTAQNVATAAQAAAEAAQADLTAMSARFDEVSAQRDALSDAITALETRLSDIEKRPLNEGLGAAAIAAYEREVKDLRDLVAAQKAEAAELKDQAALSAKSALARSSITRIVAALESGATYRAAVVDLKSATGQEVAPILETYADEGVPPLTALIESYPEAARAALAQARADKVDADSGNKLSNFFKTQLGARSVEAREGSDTDAILSRTEAALKAGDLAAALGEIETLAEGPKAVMSEWVAQAKIRLDATQAAEDLAQTLNSN